MSTLTKLNSAQLRRALQLREKIEKLESELAALVGAPAPAPAAASAPRKRKMSAAGRAAIRRAAKLRWAKFRAARKQAAQ